MSDAPTPAADSPAHRYTGALAQEIEARWQDHWDAERTFEAPNPAGPLGDPAAPQGCKVELLVRFEFKSGVLGMALSPVFEASCNTLVDAFVRRARQVYGPR